MSGAVGEGLWLARFLRYCGKRELIVYSRGLSCLRSFVSQIALSVEIAPDCVGLELDASKLKQVLYSHLSNAIKFTDDGGRVVVRARLEDERRFRLEVVDTGSSTFYAVLPRVTPAFVFGATSHEKST
jgi:signal transduction histidine kinase